MVSKTAMQNLIHDFNHGKFIGLSPTKIENLLKKYLAEEAAQIFNAYREGFYASSDNGESYYETTYQSK